MKNKAHWYIKTEYYAIPEHYLVHHDNIVAVKNSTGRTYCVQCNETCPEEVVIMAQLMNAYIVESDYDFYKNCKSRKTS